jgi:glycerate 2-kinase
VKVVLAPDKFAGTLSAAQVVRAMADGWQAARPSDELVLVPMADGGEGTIDVVEAAVSGARRQVLEVVDPRGRATRGAWLALPDGRALVEAAQACGLSLLSPKERNPLLATSYGVGQLLAAAAAAGHGEIVVGLGGSATVDGGAGMATALGHRLRRADGNGVKVGGRFVVDLDHVEVGPPLPAHVIAMSDVEIPLLGPTGAVATFAPQKGAAPADLPLLEQALCTFADVVERDLGGSWRDLPGAGAAGGLGFGLASFCNAKIEPGAPMVASLVGLEAALDGADVLVTGEGALDRQTATGKAPAYVAKLARSQGLTVLAVAGRVEDGAEAAFDGVVALGPEGLKRGAALVTARTAELAQAL